MLVRGGENVDIAAWLRSLGLQQYEQAFHDNEINGNEILTLASNVLTIRESVRAADLVIGAVLIPGASAPKLVRRDMLRIMRKGAVLVDVAIDQGGCIETGKPTSHSDPTYELDGVIHYCVTNMPGAVGRTSTIALCNATLPYALKIANCGYQKAAANDKGFAEGVNMVEGHVTNAAVAEVTVAESEVVARS